MICQSCGTSNSDSARFCSSCGAEQRAYNASSAALATESEELTILRSTRRDEAATLVDTNGDRLLGSTVAGKYRLNAKLGAGGMGAVYRAARLLIGDEVAVKLLHAEQTDPQAGERFRREAQAAARLKHPNAVNIYDFGITDEGVQYLVMELVEGESLRKIIKQQGPLPLATSSEIINQVSAALDEAHRHHIIHRDVKPDNIIVNSSANGLRVKVLDFGIAKLRDDAVSNLTQTGSMVGTPHYMSPEQCIGEELDSRADIYSLGIVLYEMLTGTVPFNSPTPGAVVVQHVNQPPAAPRVLNASITTSVERVVLHALEKRREARPQSAGAFAAELANAISNPASANQSAPPATLFMDPQASASGSATPRPLERSNVVSGNRSSTARVVGFTILATVFLLGMGGLAARMLLNPSSERHEARGGSDVHPIESPSVNQPRSTLSESTPVPTVRTPVDPPVNTPLAKREILDTLDGWAGAARAHDLDAQVAFYADVVDPYFLRHNVSVADVRTNRSLAYTRYYKLDVQLSNIDVEIDPSGSSATATFDKSYSFEGEKVLSGSVKSMLWLTKTGSRWLISGERDLKVYYSNKR